MAKWTGDVVRLEALLSSRASAWAWVKLVCLSLAPNLSTWPRFIHPCMISGPHYFGLIFEEGQESRRPNLDNGGMFGCNRRVILGGSCHIHFLTTWIAVHASLPFIAECRNCCRGSLIFLLKSLAYLRNVFKESQLFLGTRWQTYLVLLTVAGKRCSCFWRCSAYFFFSRIYFSGRINPC